MTPIPVIWLSYHENIDARGPWDTGILERLFSGESWAHGISFDHRHWDADSINNVHNQEGIDQVAVVVVPARHHCSDEDVTRLNRDLDVFKGVILILCGDEEAQFPWKDIKHDNIRFWVQMPDPVHYSDMHDYGFFFGNGVPPGEPVVQMHKTNPWVFAGQNTNIRRKEAVEGCKRLMKRMRGIMHVSQGFSEGLPRDEYLNVTARSWIVIAPSGPCNVDTFRAYEALELGCIPFVDAMTPTGPNRYWEFVYGEVPFPIVDDWGPVGGLVETVYADRYMLSARCQAWWKQQKRAMALRLRQDLTELGAHLPPPAQLSAIITTSPVPSNPDLGAIEETMESIDDVFDTPEILVACDGVRPEQPHLQANYEMYLYDLCRYLSANPRRVPYIAREWSHQAMLTYDAIVELGTAPILLFCEHDTPLVTDVPIDTESAIRVLEYGLIDVLRFHHEASILPDHEHLMIDHETTVLDGLPVRRTLQWSQRPHLARADYYELILRHHFRPTSRTMIEDKMHSVVQSAKPGEHRIAVYHPPGQHIKRSYHLDSRGAEDKYPMKF